MLLMHGRKLIFFFLVIPLISSFFELITLKKLNSEILNSDDIDVFFEQAGDGVDIFIEPKKDTSFYFLKSGMRKTNAGDSEEAIIDFDKAIQMDPANASAYYNRGLAKKRLQDLNGAVNDYNQAIFFNPLFWEAYINRGNANELGDYQVHWKI